MKPIHVIKNLLRDGFYTLGMATICFCAILLFSCKGIDSEAVSLETPFTIEAIEEGNVVLSIVNGFYDVSIKYSINQGDLQEATFNDSLVIKLSKGDIIEIFRDDDEWPSPAVQKTPMCYIYGNIMSLLSSESYSELTSIKCPHAFSYMFEGNTNIMLHDSKKLILPAKRLSKKCYQSMFEGCTSLLSAPELPAKILAEECYEGMFQGCTGLTTVPELPATVLSEGCYAGMFAGCTSLMSAPDLPAMRMEKACYRAMFADCVNLSKAPELPAMQLAKKCYAEMFYNCPNLEEPPLLPATQLERDCYKDMFGNDKE